MKRVALLVVVIACGSKLAAAQIVEGGYVAAVVGTNVAGKTSVLVGAEAGGRLTSEMDIFVELGRVADLPTATRDTSAATISGGIAAQLGQQVTFDARTPTIYGGVGLRYFVPMMSGLVPHLAPYLEGVAGFARTKENVSFSVGGTDVTSRISDFGVTLGSDLAGSPTVGTLGLGIGVRLPRGPWHLDVGYRYTRLFTARQGTNSNRMHVAVAYRF
jgi:hypothetical protein